MSRPTALLISGALTAFVSVSVAVLVLWLRAPAGDPASTVAASSGAAGGAGGSVTTDTEQLYHQRLDQANAQLRQAYDRLRQLEAENATLRGQNAGGPVATGASGPAAESNDGLVSRDEAVAIARDLVGDGNVQTVELEREHGAMIYEIGIGSQRVYVDAATGEAGVARDRGEEHGDD